MHKFSATLLLLCGSLQAAEFKAGVARTVITPQQSMEMAGYAARTRPSEGTLHDLWAKALAVEDADGGRAVIVTTDVIALPREMTEEVAARVAAKHKLARAQILFNASHTHSGPVVWPSIRSMYDSSPEQQRRAVAYAEKLTNDLTGLVEAALADLAPAKISFSRGSVGFAMNRRQPTTDGVRIGVNATGPVDHEVPVLRIAAPDGKLRAVLFAYACHNTTLGGDCYQFHGDYAGFAQIELEKACPGTTAMFLTGCGADQNPGPRGTLELAAKHGKSLADEVGRVLAGELRPLRPPIRAAFATANLDFAPHDRARFEEEAKQGDRYRQTRAKAMLEAYDKGQPVRTLDMPVQAVRFNNDLTLLALGGEVVVDYALRLKREFPQDNLVVAGYSNDVMCYIPSLRVLREGGYEAADAMIYFGRPGPFAENVEDTVVAACRQVLDETRGEPSR